MMNIAHDREPYGHLVAPDGSALTLEQLARLVRSSLTLVRKLLAELEANNVFSRTEANVIYSRRMVKDEQFRNQRAAFGKMGGNPALVNLRLRLMLSLGLSQTQPLQFQLQFHLPFHLQFHLQFRLQQQQ
jgi:hypothetical protein